MSIIAPERARPVAATGPSGRLAGLDGLRAIAVLLVVAYHFAPGLLPGGYLGVDVFFVLSGFLITTILLREHAREGRVSLRRFWVHRARRLVPALVAVVTVCVAVVSAAVAALQVRGDPVEGTPWGDLLVGVAGQLAAAATFTSNWQAVLAGESYAAAASPPLLGNLWSLAVEEQFYLVWPLVVLGLLGAGVALRRAAVGAAAIAVASAAAMALTVGVGDPTRAYVGTDTHAFGLMVGAALAFAWARRGEAARGRGAAAAAGVAGAVTLAALAATMHWDAPWTYRGGLLLASVATAALIVAVLRLPAAGRALDARPLRWVGERSYGIYLWHWPLLVILATTVDGGRIRDASAVTVAVAAALTLGAAAASYRWIETPVRARGFRAAAGALVDWLHPDPVDGAGDPARVARRRRAVLFGGAVAAVLALTGSAVAAAPARTSLEMQLERGERAIAAADDGPPPASPAAASSPLALRTAAPTPARAPERAAPVEAPRGPDVVVIGDSVTVGSADALKDALPGVVIKAKVGKQFATGVDEVVDMVERDVLRPYVVIALGTNGAIRADDLDRLLDAAGDTPVVLVTPYGDRSWMPGAQRAIREAATRHPTVILADWQRAVERDPSILGSDGIHPRPSGVPVFVSVVERGLLEAAELAAAR